MNSATVQLDVFPDNVNFSSPPKKKLRSSVNDSTDKVGSEVHDVKGRRSPRFVRLENNPMSSSDRKKDPRNSNLKSKGTENHCPEKEGSQSIDPSIIPEESEIFGQSPDSKAIHTKPMPVTSSEKKKTVRRSKRRSSFITGRISKSFSVVPAPDPFEDISTDLPQDKRLELLHSKALENVLHTMEESFPNLPNFAEFRIKALDSAGTTIASLCEQGEFIKATAPPEMLLNDAQGRALEEQIRQTESEIKRFNSESEKWDKILAEYKQLAEAAERLQQNTDDNSAEMDIPPVLSKSQQAVLDDRIDVKSMYAQLKTLCEKQVLCMDEISHQAELQADVFRQSDQYVETQAKLIGAKSFPDLQTDPKELIINITRNTDSDLSQSNSS